MKLVIFEDHQPGRFHPLSWVRGVFELKSGAVTLTRKLERAAGMNVSALLVRAELADVVRQRHPGVAVNDLRGCRGEEVLFVNARVCGSGWTPADHRVAAWRGDDLATWRTTADVSAIGDFTALCCAAARSDRVDFEGPWFEYIWDLMLRNPAEIKADFAAAGRRGVEGAMHPSAVIFGPAEDVYIAPGAELHPFVCIDTRNGPVTLESGVEVHPYTRIEGPCYVGPRSILLGAKIREGCSIGPMCRVGGEVEESIIHGYSNKYHDGFLGHAYVGEWVNLGALTTNSDLKNDYGSVSVCLDGKTPLDTGSNKVGSFIGDHVKTSIATLLNTGTHIGPGAVLVAHGAPLPKYIPPFAWFLDGKISKGYGLGPALQTARTAMSRRKVQLAPAEEQLLRSLFEATTDDRNLHVRRARKAAAGKMG